MDQSSQLEILAAEIIFPGMAPSLVSVICSARILPLAQGQS
jgi:hypothetical protein